MRILIGAVLMDRGIQWQRCSVEMLRAGRLNQRAELLNQRRQLARAEWNAEPDGRPKRLAGPAVAPVPDLADGGNVTRPVGTANFQPQLARRHGLQYRRALTPLLQRPQLAGEVG